MLLLLSLLAVFTSGAAEDCSCGESKRQVQAGQLGILSSPNYPRGFACGTTDCQWTLSAGGSRVTVEFQTGEFDLESGYDFLNIYDGDVLVRRCTGNFCQSVTSAGPTLTLALFKDDSDSSDFQGFVADFHAANTPLKTTTTMSPACLCGTQFHVVPQDEPYGTLTSPAFPSNYCNNLDCTWQLYTAGSPVSLSFPKFDLANDDHLYVYDGPDDSSPIIARCSGGYCGNVTTSSELISMQFITNPQNALNGWVCRFFPTPTTTSTSTTPTTATTSTTTSTTTTEIPTTTSSSTTTTPTTTSTTTPTTTTEIPTTTGIPQGVCQTCYDFYTSGQGDGVYTLQLWDPVSSTHLETQAYCRMGHTTFMQRADGSVSFRQPWATYKVGFGSVQGNGEYWLGNDALHLITTHCGSQQLRVDLYSCGSSAYESYSQFSIDDESAFYQASMSAGTGTASDALTGTGADNMSGLLFTTIDQQHDQRAVNDNCAKSHYGGGGWWYPKDCGYANPTGQYEANCPSQDGHNLFWYNWPSPGWAPTLSALTMSVFPANTVDPLA